MWRKKPGNGIVGEAEPGNQSSGQRDRRHRGDGLGQHAHLVGPGPDRLGDRGAVPDAGHGEHADQHDQARRLPGIGLPRFGAVKNYTIEVSGDGTTWTTAATGTVKTDPPRPVSPELNYPTITLATPVRANFVRLDVNDSQGPVTELSVGDLRVFAGTP